MATQARIDPKIFCHKPSPWFRKDGNTHSGVSRDSRERTNPKKLDLVELISAAIRAAHTARDKGFYTVSHEAVRCVEILKQIKGLSLTAQAISESNTFPTMQYLAKNGNPKIRSEARSLLDHWRNILSANSGDHVKEDDRKGSCFTRKTDMKRFVRKKSYADAHSSEKKEEPQKLSGSSQSNSRRSCDRHGKKAGDNQIKTSIGKQELLELFKAAKKAAKAVKEGDLSSADASRCINTLKQLSQVPKSLTHNVILTTDIGSRLYSLTEHSNLHISSAAQSLLDFWRMILYTTGRANGCIREH